MGEVTYDKLIRFLRENPAYEFVERGNVIEVTFHTPTLADAAGVPDVEGGEETAVIRLVFERVNDKAVPREAWIERGGSRRSMGIDELELWLRYIEDLY